MVALLEFSGGRLKAGGRGAEALGLARFFFFPLNSKPILEWKSFTFKCYKIVRVNKTQNGMNSKLLLYICVYIYTHTHIFCITTVFKITLRKYFSLFVLIA